MRKLIPLIALLSLPALAKDWNVNGRGRVTYNDGSGDKPLAGAHVRLMDSDTVFDETLGEGWTDGNGNFNINGRGGDTGLPFGICDDNCTKPDPYIIIDLKNDRIEVETEIGFTWHAHTPTHDNTAGSIDFGTFHFASADGQHAQILFGRTKQQYDHFTATVGGLIPSHGGKINVLFPALLAAGVPWTTEESMHWPGSESRWNAVYHEFGHRIREAADGDFAHFLGDVISYSYLQQHWYDKKTNAGFAFNEGFAEYHSTLLDPNERNTFAAWHVNGGDDIEGNVAAKLAGLSNKCGGFKNMWAVLSDHSRVHSYAEFESTMKRKFPSCFKAAPAPAPRPSAAVVKFNPILLQHQQLVLANWAKALDARRLILVKKQYLTAKVAPPLAAHQQTLVKLHALRAASRAAWRAAAISAFKKHLGSFKPITEASAKSKQYLADRQAARSGFIQEAFSAQLKEIEKVAAEVKKERADAKSAPLHPHFDFLLARYSKRTAELKQALAQKASPDMKIPVHLLPRAFGAEVAK